MFRRPRSERLQGEPHSSSRLTNRRDSAWRPTLGWGTPVLAANPRAAVAAAGCPRAEAAEEAAASAAEEAEVEAAVG
jgi:hypothetical protein